MTEPPSVYGKLHHQLEQLDQVGTVCSLVTAAREVQCDRRKQADTLHFLHFFLLALRAARVCRTSLVLKEEGGV